jgi:hypothetical protein
MKIWNEWETVNSFILWAAKEKNTVLHTVLSWQLMVKFMMLGQQVVPILKGNIMETVIKN